jgi:hypothetical protein
MTTPTTRKVHHLHLSTTPPDALRRALETGTTPDGSPITALHVHGTSSTRLHMTPSYQRDVGGNTASSWATLAGLWATLPVHGAVTAALDRRERLRREHLLASEGLRLLQSVELTKLAGSSVTELVLDHLNLPDAAAAVLAQLVRASDRLDTLKLVSSTNPMTVRGHAVLSQALRESRAPLRCVYVEGLTLRGCVPKARVPVVEAPPPTLVLSSASGSASSMRSSKSKPARATTTRTGGGGTLSAASSASSFGSSFAPAGGGSACS